MGAALRSPVTAAGAKNGDVTETVKPLLNAGRVDDSVGSDGEPVAPGVAAIDRCGPGARETGWPLSLPSLLPSLLLVTSPPWAD